MTINPFDVLKNAQQIQAQMGAFQEKLGGIVETGASGGGMVEVEINGKMEVLAVRISPEIAEPFDIQITQDLCAAAFNAALDKIKERVKRELGAMAGGMGLPNIPGLFG
jgi:DNA-binding YbaB/EbfC family protein